MRLVETALRRLQCAAAMKLLHGAAALLAAAVPLLHAAAPVPPRAATALEWQPEPGASKELLRPLALGEVEQRFARQFPGAIVKLTDGRRQWVLREVQRPTRMLHAADDCYRGLGYRILQSRLEADALGLRWRCFEAERNGRRVRVCERIVDAAGTAYTDASSWYWAALLGQTHGPWRAVTVSTPA